MSRHPQAQKKKCGAKTRSGDPCEAWAVRGATRCRMHGGTTPKGMAAPSYKHGRYSRYLPGGLAERYAEGLRDADLLSLRDEIALLDVRISELLQNMDARSSAQLFGRIHQAYADVQKARRAGDAEALAAAMDELGSTITRGAGNQEAWEELTQLLERRRKLVHSEAGRLERAGQTITAEKAMMIITAIIDLMHEQFQRHGIPERVYRAIATRINQFVATGSSEPADAVVLEESTGGG